MSQSQLHGCVRRRLVRSVKRCFIVFGLVVVVGVINPSTRCKQNEHFLVWTNNISCTTIKRRSSTAGVICRSPPALKCRQTINGLCRDRPYHCLLRHETTTKTTHMVSKKGRVFCFLPTSCTADFDCTSRMDTKDEPGLKWWKTRFIVKSKVKFWSKTIYVNIHMS